LPDPSAMIRLLGIVIAFSAVGFALMANHYWSTTKYQLNGSTFNVPQRYNMMPYYRTRFTLKSGLVAEPDQTVSLILPAKELARDVQGYNELFHGYSSGDVPAFITVTVSGGEAVHDFTERYFAAWNQVRQLEEGGAPPQPDPATGLERINEIPSGFGSLGAGHSIFYLVPRKGQPLPQNSLPTSCLAYPDEKGRENYDCNYTIRRNSLIFNFNLKEENLQFAERIPTYAFSRLVAWEPCPPLRRRLSTRLGTSQSPLPGVSPRAPAFNRPDLPNPPCPSKRPRGGEPGFRPCHR
jgi:hypothetical protein